MPNGRSIRRRNKSHKSIRKTRSKKGGSYCVFEHPEHFNVVYKDNQNCKDARCEPCSQTRNYFYFLHNMTLFAFTSHVFKHFDTIPSAPQPSDGICSRDKTSEKTRRIRFSTNYAGLDGNLPVLIHNMQGLIESLDLSHELLKRFKTPGVKTNGKYYITIYRGYTFFWDKHRMPTKPEQYKDNPLFVQSLLTCVNIMHVNKSKISGPKCNIGLGRTQKSNMDNQPGIIEGISPIKTAPVLFEKQEAYDIAVANKRKHIDSSISKKAAKVSSSINTNIKSISEKLEPPPKFKNNDTVLYNSIEYKITDVFHVSFTNDFVYNLMNKSDTADIGIYVPETELIFIKPKGPSSSTVVMKMDSTPDDIMPSQEPAKLHHPFEIGTNIKYTTTGKKPKVIHGKIIDNSKPGKYKIEYIKGVSSIGESQNQSATVNTDTITLDIP